MNLDGTPEWKPGALERVRMIPLIEPTHAEIAALPDGTEVMVIYLMPLGMGFSMSSFDMGPENRAKALAYADDPDAARPQIVVFSLPTTTDTSSIEAFVNQRKDTDDEQ